MMSQIPQEPNFDSPLGGRYKIIGQLGSGGFGQTYLVQDLHLPGHPQCVVKKLLPQKRNAENLDMARRLFDTEAKVLYKLGNHSQIPRLLAHFEENQEFYLAQEFIEGEPLSKELIEGQPWIEPKVIDLLRDILEVLAFVHEQQVIHRDIKPPNLIRRRQDGKMVLIDFGAVKQVSTHRFDADTDEGTDLTISIGTQGYIPNEQIAGKPRFSSDVYAVGIIGIRALTGVHPKRLNEDLETGEINWHEYAPQVSPELATVLDRMVCYDFRDRYPTAIEALESLRTLTGVEFNFAKGSYAQPLTEPQPLLIQPSYSIDSFKRVEMERESPTRHWPQADATTKTLTLAYSPESATVLDPSQISDVEVKQPEIRKSSKRRHHLAKSILAIATLTAAGLGIIAAKTWLDAQPAVRPVVPARLMGSALIDFLPEQRAFQSFNQAERLRQDGRYQQALSAYEKAIELNPDLAEAYWGRCASLNGLDRSNEAIVACNDALAINPSYAKAVQSKGNALELQERLIEALRLYEWATALDPDLAEAWVDRGKLLQRLGRSAEAIVSLDQAIAINRDLADAWSTRGVALWNLRRYNEAIASLDKALQLQPEHPEALELRQLARDSLGR